MNRDHYNIWYYGCFNAVGHFFYLPSGSTKDTEPLGVPPRFGRYGIEKLLTTTREGEGQFFKEAGWTAFGYPDQSGDKRPGSISIFVAKGDYDVERLIALARECFSRVWTRRSTPVDFGGKKYHWSAIEDAIVEIEHKIISSLGIPSEFLLTAAPVAPVERILEEGPPEAGVVVKMDDIPDDEPTAEEIRKLEEEYTERLAAQEEKLKAQTGLGFEAPTEEKTEGYTPGREVHVELKDGGLGLVEEVKIVQGKPPKKRR